MIDLSENSLKRLRVQFEPRGSGPLGVMRVVCELIDVLLELRRVGGGAFELLEVKRALRNHSPGKLCGNDCTLTDHIRGVYQDLEDATNRLRELKRQVGKEQNALADEQRRADAFARDIEANYDCEEDAHRHNNGGCRSCKAKAFLARKG
jgi:hypothetical protein